MSTLPGWGGQGTGGLGRRLDQKGRVQLEVEVSPYRKGPAHEGGKLELLGDLEGDLGRSLA